MPQIEVDVGYSNGIIYRYLSSTSSTSSAPPRLPSAIVVGSSGMAGVAEPDSSTSPVPSSPSVVSPRGPPRPGAGGSWSQHSWPTPAWQCFVQGTAIKFLIPNLETPWQRAEELGWKDRNARDSYQYAPNGLTVVKVS